MSRERVLVCGGRGWTDIEAIRRRLATLPPDTLVIHGAARGADTCGDEAARMLGMEVMAFPADWERWGKSAGPRRNRRMLTEGAPTRVWAFHRDLRQSIGTLDMLSIAAAAGVPCELFGT